jgi:hypothetical protein
MSKSITIEDFTKSASRASLVVAKYRALIFFIVIASLYGFILWRINVLSNAPPSQADISTAEKGTAGPHVSDTVVQKLQSLQDNSVSVQTLFEEARNNPFNE